MYSYYFKETELKITMFIHFQVYPRNGKIWRVYMVLGDAETFVWDYGFGTNMFQGP